MRDVDLSADLRPRHRDTLCPEDAPDETLETTTGVRSLAVPGGRRALELAEPVRLSYGEDTFDVEIRTPLLPGAVVVKANAALDRRTAGQHRHIQDVAALMSVVEDPLALRNSLTEVDVQVVGALAPRLADDSDVAWSGMDAPTRLRGQAAARIVTA